MPIPTDKLIKHIERIAPPQLAEAWDNTGVQIDAGNAETRRVLVALDVTRATAEEAERINADFILCHHPLLFDKLEKIDARAVVGGLVIRLIRAGVSVYAAHTSFDAVFGGNNDRLAELLGLRGVRRIPPREGENENDGAPIGKLGEFASEMGVAEVCERIRAKLNVARPLPVAGDPARRVKKVALCTGAGRALLEDAVKNACDVLITGDVTYHDALFARESGLCVIDAGHFATELPFEPNIAAKLREAAGGLVEIYESRASRDPFSYI